MPEILYSDIEITAKIIMDPNTMAEALKQLQMLHPEGCLKRLANEMESVLTRLADMGCLSPRAMEILKM